MVISKNRDSEVNLFNFLDCSLDLEK